MNVDSDVQTISSMNCLRRTGLPMLHDASSDCRAWCDCAPSRWADVALWCPKACCWSSYSVPSAVTNILHTLRNDFSLKAVLAVATPSFPAEPSTTPTIQPTGSSSPSPARSALSTLPRLTLTPSQRGQHSLVLVGRIHHLEQPHNTATDTRSWIRVPPRNPSLSLPLPALLATTGDPFPTLKPAHMEGAGCTPGGAGNNGGKAGGRCMAG
ncbi:hypothetical protein C8F01DRAFT_748967 [Mycena amicta]|nr:hypothetical protein C8F01DRAFT_748967 [Mycena amicta]